METKWSEKHRLHLYQRLNKEFGAFSDRNYSPTNKAFFVKMRKELKAMGLKTTDGGIKNQIQWATTKQTKIDPGYTKTWILNVAAALEYGFITMSDIPAGIKLKKG